MSAERTARLVWRQIAWPRPLDVNAASGLLRQWAADQRAPRLVLEVRADSRGVHYLLGVPHVYLGSVKQSLTHLVPGASLTQSLTRQPARMAGRLKATTRHRALQTSEPEAIVRAILGGLAQAHGEDEELILQLLLGPRRVPLAIPTNTSSALVQPWWRATLYGTSTRLDGEKRTALRAKVGEHGFAMNIRLGVRAGTQERRRSLLLGLLAGIRTAEASGVALQLRPERPARLHDAKQPWFWPLRLNVSELLGLTAWPLGDDPLPGLPAKHPRLLPADVRVRDQSRVVTMATAPGATRPLGLSAHDALQHTHVLGPTGTGKSTLLLNLITADIVAGRGLIVIDPKGDLVNDVLARVPDQRRDDIVVLDPSDEAPVGLNPLAGAVRSPELAADGVLAVFRSLYADSWGPRTEDILHASLLTLGSRQDVSLVYLPLLLTNPGFRRSLTAKLRDPVALGPFWAWYEAISDAERQAAVAPVMNKLRAFLLRPAMRAVLGQVRPKFELGQVFTERKVLLVSLAKGVLGQETAALLGSLVVAQVWHATLARANVDSSRRHPVMLYIDEVQDYLRLPTDLADALAQARGLGVGFTLAHQFLAQLSPAMRAAVLANARSRVCFQLGPDDATAMARLHPQLEPEDFRALGRYEIYASLVARGQVTPFASGRTLPPIKACSNPAELRRLSRERYGQALSQVEAGFAELARGDRHDDQDSVQRRSRRST